MFKTSIVKQKDLKQKWYLINAQGIRLGRLATKVAGLIMGKNKVQKKMYRTHSGNIGRLNERTFADLIKTNPERIINNAVKGMLPQNKLGKMLIKNLYIYPQELHPHSAQKPEQINIKYNNK